MNTFAPFKSRSEALRLYNAMKEARLAAAVINTPRGEGLPCGISVLFDGRIKEEVENILKKLPLRSFYGFREKDGG